MATQHLLQVLQHIQLKKSSRLARNKFIKNQIDDSLKKATPNQVRALFYVAIAT